MYHVVNRNPLKWPLMIYCFDLDGTLCSLTDGQYEEAQPFLSRVQHVNRLFEQGHTIRIFTARGATTGKSWLALTESQLKEWGVRHHELFMGKPGADIYVDDKAVHSDSYDWDKRD